jgi:hypothetical protein
MKRTICALVASLSTALALALVGQAAAAPIPVPPVVPTTVLKLDLGADADDDMEMTSGQFSTVNDGNGTTTGSQNTSVEFLDFLQSYGNLSGASFTLGGLNAMPTSTTFFGSLVEQDFQDGTLAIYSPENELLLSANLSISAVTGPLGSPGKEGLFLGFGEVTGGEIAHRLLKTSLLLRMRLPTINTGGGFSVSPAPSSPVPLYYAPLDSFSAGASLEIRAIEVAEPSLLPIAAVAALGLLRRRRRARR